MPRILPVFILLACLLISRRHALPQSDEILNDNIEKIQKSEILKSLICPAGSALSYDSTRCILCPPGYFSTGGKKCTSSTNSGSVCCSACPNGHICSTEGTSFPVQCQPGTAANYQGTDCVKCLPGYFAPTAGRQCTSSTNSANVCCKSCPSGHVCPTESTVVPIECQPGTAANYQKTECVQCPPGYHTKTKARQCTSSTNTGSVCCSSCPTGHKCPNLGTINPILCTAGSSANYYGTDCIQCPPGYLTYTNARQCTSSTNTGSVCCNSCPQGHICPSTNTSVPIICPAGSAANYQRTECLKCSPGSLTETDGSQCSSSSNSVGDCCSGCPTGHICPNLGTSKPIICPAGTAANYQKTECFKCSEGYTSSIGAQCSSSSNTASVCCRKI